MRLGEIFIVHKHFWNSNGSIMKGISWKQTLTLIYFGKNNKTVYEKETMVLLQSGKENVKQDKIGKCQKKIYL